MDEQLTLLEVQAALQKLMNSCCATYSNEICGTKKNKACAKFRNYKIIENALKEKAQQDSIIKILKETIEFKRTLPYVPIEPDEDAGFHIMSCVSINIQRDIENKERELLREWILETCFPKELKALKIIEKKNVAITLIKTCENLHQYNLVCPDEEKLTQEEFDLLKHVLL